MAGKRIYGILMGIALIGILAGCGDGSAEDSDYGAFIIPEYVAITMPPVGAGPAVPEETRLVYSTGKLTEEEENIILENMKTLLQNLEVTEYVGEGIHMISSEEWFEAMAPRLYEGSRTYMLQKGEETLLSVLVAYDVFGETYSSVFYKNSADQVTVLRQEGNVTQLVQAQVTEEGQYDGSFEMWWIDSASGEMRYEQGKYVNGVIIGEYTVATCSAPAGSAFDLWSNRERFAYETSTVIYAEGSGGVSTMKPQTEASQKPEASQNPATTQKPTTTQKPAATQKPATTQKPAATQAPAPTQEPAPPNQDDDNGDDDGNSGSEGTDSGNSDGNSGGGSTDSGSSGGDTGGDSGGSGGDTGSDSGSSGGDSGGSDSGSSGGDVDIEWSDDIL